MAVAIARRRDDDDQSGARLQLRRAIEDAKNTKIRLAKLRDAIERATEHQEFAAAKLRDTTAAAAKAKAEFATLTAAAIAKGEPPPVATTLQDARAAETEAADQSGAAHSALAELEQQYADLEIECAKADNCVVTAANGLLVEPMRALFERAKKAQAEMMVCRAALRELDADNGPKFADEIRAYRAREERDRPLAEIKSVQEVKDLVHIGACLDQQATDKASAARAKWKAARIALMNDPDTRLPE